MRRNTSALLVLTLLLAADAICIGHTLRSSGSVSFSDMVRWLFIETIAAALLLTLTIRVLAPAFLSLGKAALSVRRSLRRLFVSVWF